MTDRQNIELILLILTSYDAHLTAIETDFKVISSFLDEAGLDHKEWKNKITLRLATLKSSVQSDMYLIEESKENNKLTLAKLNRWEYIQEGCYMFKSISEILQNLGKAMINGPLESKNKVVFALKKLCDDSIKLSDKFGQCYMLL